MKKTSSTWNIKEVLGAAVLAVGLLLYPGHASATDHGTQVKRWRMNGYHDISQDHYIGYNRSFKESLPTSTQPRNYEYFRGHRGYWENQNGSRVFVRE